MGATVQANRICVDRVHQVTKYLDTKLQEQALVPRCQVHSTDMPHMQDQFTCALMSLFLAGITDQSRFVVCLGFGLMAVKRVA